MGSVMSMALRKVNRFNVENRAHRVLDREKPTAAPSYDSALHDRQRTLEVDPDYIEKQSKVDPDLNERLKHIFVTSKDIHYGIERKDAEDKPLPTDRASVEDFEYGYMEPKTVSRGRCTLRQAVKFITDNQGDPVAWTPEKIADEYKLKKQVVDDILTHFRSFGVYLPDNSSKNVLTQNKEKLLEKDPV